MPELQRETRKEDAQAVESEEVAAAQLRLAYLQMADAIEAWKWKKEGLEALEMRFHPTSS